MSPRRKGQGDKIDQTAWPADGKMRDWLVYCDQVHQGNGLPSLSALAAALRLKNRSDVGGMLRGLRLPADEAQARRLLTALGADDGEVDRGLRKYRAARAERDTQVRIDQGVRRPDWWLRSGYIGQVADIAPLQLLQREDELAELAAWCTGGDEAYVWWQAGPRAGKSALMSWFVLHPPPGVWVVSFFVTARYTGQADSTAFTDELIDQFAAITGRQVPPVTSARERDRLRRELFEAAAARAVKAGHRLVLLVDGLDEDCGSHPGSGLPSIARCLPKYPGDGVRVIVAGRPDPPLPADVNNDPDHPLHRCRVRVLTASPHAQKVMQLAQDELDQVLATDPDRDDGLGYQVLGLVTASGGGLEHRDLHELTGRPVFEIDRLLHGVFGRTIAGRTDPHAPHRVFLFTHETLRVQAIGRLGPHTLAGFAQRLHTWATGYQRQGWPVDTPAYLLRGYPRMLTDTGDLDRLVALATDAARHDRMLDATGGDAAALAEIAIAQALISTQPRPDLAAALRLAWYRDHLAGRNTHIPTHLPAVWAALGQPVRAEGLARSLTDAYRQARALSGVARAVADAGEHERAEQIARSLTDPYRQARTLSGLAQAAADAGELDRARTLATDAEQIARSLTHPAQQAYALAGLARAVADAGELELARMLVADAEQIARSLTDPYRQARALSGLARAVADAGELELARMLVADAEQIARSLTDPEQQERALTGLARAAADAGEHERAEQIARSLTSPYQRAQALAGLARAATDAGEHERAEQIARTIINPHLQAQALARLARAAADTGEHERAEQIARSFTDWDQQAEALAGLARAAADAGEYERARMLANDAEQIARSLIEPYQRAQDLIGLARAATDAGEYERARMLANDAEQIARSLTNQEQQAQALTGLARAVADVGEYERAEQIARSLTNLRQQTYALTGLARAAADAGQHERAEQIARTITNPYQQAQALAHLARAAADAGQHEGARTLATDAEQIARSLTNPEQQAQALAGLSRAVADVGQHEWAEQIAWSITNPYQQAYALADLYRAVADAGQHERARALATDAEQIARSLTSPYQQARALTGVARAAAETGEYEQASALTADAEQIARSITDPSRQAQALACLVRTVTDAGEHERAEQIARSIADPYRQAQALTELAGGARPANARSLIVAALAVGRWTMPLTVAGCLDPRVFSDFVDECILGQPMPPLSG